MKNIHLLPTDKLSRLAYVGANGLCLGENFPNTSYCKPQNIYITSDEEIKEGDWFMTNLNEILKCTKKEDKFVWYERLTVPGVSKIAQPFSIHINLKPKKIILTTDQDLIEDGVQAIDDDFLEWFVKNPSCEEVKIESWQTKGEWDLDYKIIIPVEETKQQSIEDLIESTAKTFSDVYKEEKEKQTAFVEFKHGAYFMAKRVYSEEEMISFAEFVATYPDKNRNVYGEMLHSKSKYDGAERTIDLLEQFKKK